MISHCAQRQGKIGVRRFIQTARLGDQIVDKTILVLQHCHAAGFHFLREQLVYTTKCASLKNMDFYWTVSY